ncbi:MAG: hypothetical protein RI957_1618 [Verrucomicrobiota bacterium]
MCRDVAAWQMAGCAAHECLGDFYRTRVALVVGDADLARVEEKRAQLCLITAMWLDRCQHGPRVLVAAECSMVAIHLPCTP